MGEREGGERGERREGREGRRFWMRMYINFIYSSTTSLER